MDINSLVYFCHNNN